MVLRAREVGVGCETRRWSDFGEDVRRRSLGIDERGEEGEESVLLRVERERVEEKGRLLRETTAR
jgi:hypothetical protein